jgi:hypothetical protein
MRTLLSVCVIAGALSISATVSATSEAPDITPVTPRQEHFRQSVYAALRTGGVVTAASLVILIGWMVCRECKGCKHPGGPK